MHLTHALSVLEEVEQGNKFILNRVSIFVWSVDEDIFSEIFSPCAFLSFCISIISYALVDIQFFKCWEH